MLVQVIKQYIKFMARKVPLASCVLLGTYILLANAEVSDDTDARQAYLNEIQFVNLEVPSDVPTMTQTAVDAAIEMFAVDVPSDTQAPQFDKELFDRGLTSGNLLGQQKTILVGPAAFTSWGILGSTLGHEAEVHARQSFLKIVASDRWSQFKASVSSTFEQTMTAFASGNKKSTNDGLVSPGTLAAEQEAYIYELNSALRFGLTHRETRAIRHVMDTYYK